MKKIAFLFVIVFVHVNARSQEKLWTEEDRKYLLYHLERSRDSVLIETKNLSQSQWNFKESPGRWSIKEVVEHIAIYELLFEREISQAFNSPAQVDLKTSSRPDSAYLGFILEEKPHVTTDYSKPFTFAVPMGLNEGNNNVAWLMKMRNESVEFVKTTTADLRSHIAKAGRPNIHQLYIYVFGHTDRHLRQIRKIKQDPRFPK
jgi:hypothetical protein